MPSKSHTSALAARAIMPQRSTSSGGDLGEGLRCSLQRRSRGGVSVGDHERDAVEQKVLGTRRFRRRGEGLGGAADLQEDFSSAEVPGGGRRVPGGQVGLARELQVERLELPRGLQQQRGSIAGEARGEGDPAAQEFHLGVLELVERPGLCRRHEIENRVESAGL